MKKLTRFARGRESLPCEIGREREPPSPGLAAGDGPNGWMRVLGEIWCEGGIARITCILAIMAFSLEGICCQGKKGADASRSRQQSRQIPQPAARRKLPEVSQHQALIEFTSPPDREMGRDKMLTEYDILLTERRFQTRSFVADMQAWMAKTKVDQENAWFLIDALYSYFSSIILGEIQREDVTLESWVPDAPYDRKLQEMADKMRHMLTIEKRLIELSIDLRIPLSDLCDALKVQFDSMVKKRADAGGK